MFVKYRSILCAVLVLFTSLSLLPVTAQNCGNFTNFNEHTIEYIVSFHNILRRDAALGRRSTIPVNGSNIMEMVWFDNVTRLAEERIKNCELDACRTDCDEESQCNSFAYNATLERSDFDIVAIRDFLNTNDRLMDRANEDNIRSYVHSDELKVIMQILWAKTWQIGCAHSFRDIGDRLTYSYEVFLLCMYCPKGNIEGESVYEVGIPCSECPDNFLECHETYELCKYNPDITRSIISTTAPVPETTLPLST